MKSYKDIDGWFSLKDVESYRRLISSLPDNSVIAELGSWKGRSICSVADIILQKNITVYIVDTFQGTESEGDAHKEAKETDLKSGFQKTMYEFGLHDKIKLYAMTTDSAALEFQVTGIKFDFVFVDADHSTEAVTKDIKNYSKLLKDKNSILAGHDLSWETVRKAIEICVEDTNTVTHNGENLWWFEPGKVKYVKDNWELVSQESDLPDYSVTEADLGGITVVICTKDRYNSLYNTLLCIVNQSLLPEAILVYDDSDNKQDLSTDFKWQSLMQILGKSEIKIDFINTTKHGQNKNHQLSIYEATTKLIFRVDDDVILGKDVIRKLWFTFIGAFDIGAVAPRVIMPNNNLKFSEVSGNIDDIYSKAGIQLCVDGSGRHTAQHLHCCFLYDRTSKAKYLDDLSLIGFREESAFTYDLYRLGYKLIVDLDTEVYHVKADIGGARCLDPLLYREMVEHDEKKFQEYLQNIEKESSNRDYTVTPEEAFYFVFLNSGIGDHFAFKPILSRLQEDYKKIIIACCYPEVFWDVKDIELISLEEGKKILKDIGKKESDYSVYEVMQNNQEEFKKKDENHIVQAYRKIYL